MPAKKKEVVKKEVKKAANKATPKHLKVLDKTNLDLLLTQLIEEMNDTKRMVWTNFLIGTMRGLGFVIGTALVIVLLVWLFKTLGGVPWIGDWIVRGIDFVRENMDLGSLPTAADLQPSMGSGALQDLQDKVNNINSFLSN